MKIIKIDTLKIEILKIDQINNVKIKLGDYKTFE